MFCKNCGHEITEKFCPNCGAGVDGVPVKPSKQPVYKKWWFWVIVAVLVISVVSCSSGGQDSNVTQPEGGIQGSVEQQEKPNVPAEFAQACPIVVTASVEDNIIGVPELNCHVENKSDKEIAAVQLYFIPKDVYGDEVNSIFTTNKLFTDTAIAAGSSNTISYQLLDDEVKTGDLYIYSVYFTDGTEWGDKDTSVSTIKKYGVKITIGG